MLYNHRPKVGFLSVSMHVCLTEDICVGGESVPLVGIRNDTFRSASKRSSRQCNDNTVISFMKIIDLQSCVPTDDLIGSM